MQGRRQEKTAGGLRQYIEDCFVPRTKQKAADRSPQEGERMVSSR